MIGDDCEISLTASWKTVLEAACSVGLFARLLWRGELATGAHVGNFRGNEKGAIKEGSKAGHLSYSAMPTLEMT